MAVTVGTMQLTLSMVIMQVPTSVAILRVLRFYCNFVLVLSATLTLVDLFVAVMTVTVSVAIIQLQVLATLMQVKISTANVDENFY